MNTKKKFNNEIKFNYKNWNEKGMEKIMNDIIPYKIKLNLEYVNSDSEEDNNIYYKNSYNNEDKDEIEEMKISEDDNEEIEDEEKKENENKNIEDNKINNNNLKLFDI